MVGVHWLWWWGRLEGDAGGEAAGGKGSAREVPGGRWEEGRVVRLQARGKARQGVEPVPPTTTTTRGKAGKGRQRGQAREGRGFTAMLEGGRAGKAGRQARGQGKGQGVQQGGR